ncbi:MAG: hypothetical protein Q8O57_11930, partial [Kiritimatiellota bacterium]|nr:hypothetical protein [Kiritimatiellota bacterium]
NDGFFSIFFQVLGLADVCVARRYNLVLDFHNGPYVRPDKGTNWWAYYFEPTRFLLGPENANAVRVSNLRAQYRFSDYGRSLPPAYAHALMRTMGLTVKADILSKVSAFTEARFRGKLVVGIHYRGTDKVCADGKRTESARVPYAYVAEYLQRHYPSSLFFVATDEASFLDYLNARLPGRIVYNNAIRSVNGNAVHHGAGDGAHDQAGEDALMDCLLLSHCRVLVRTTSNLSLACHCFNPQLESLDITGLYRKRP